MEIRKECIGQIRHTKAPNGISMRIVIEDKESEFPLYKTLGLDVFEDGNYKSKIIGKFDLGAMSLKELKEYAKPLGIKGTSKKEIIMKLS